MSGPIPIPPPVPIHPTGQNGAPQPRMHPQELASSMAAVQLNPTSNPQKAPKIPLQQANFPKYEGWTLRKADSLPHEKKTWSRVEKSQSPFSENDLAKIVKNAKGKIAVRKAYNELPLSSQRQIIDRLIAERDRAETDPSAKWSLVFLDRTESRNQRTRTRETDEIIVILQRNSSFAANRLHDTNANILDLQIPLPPSKGQAKKDGKVPALMDPHFVNGIGQFPIQDEKKHKKPMPGAVGLDQGPPHAQEFHPLPPAPAPPVPPRPVPAQGYGNEQGQDWNRGYPGHGPQNYANTSRPVTNFPVPQPQHPQHPQFNLHGHDAGHNIEPVHDYVQIVTPPPQHGMKPGKAHRPHIEQRQPPVHSFEHLPNPNGGPGFHEQELHNEQGYHKQGKSKRRKRPGPIKIIIDSSGESETSERTPTTPMSGHSTFTSATPSSPHSSHGRRDNKWTDKFVHYVRNSPPGPTLPADHQRGYVHGYRGDRNPFEADEPYRVLPERSIPRGGRGRAHNERKHGGRRNGYQRPEFHQYGPVDDLQFGEPYDDYENGRVELDRMNYMRNDEHLRRQRRDERQFPSPRGRRHDYPPQFGTPGAGF
ncbi:MAG: hypothetical protein M1820_003345 [Bogoriella megaspora]|nr:MAG: hypothetical protein M1820_003345 [Bogoriella megaspora]